MTQTPEDVGYQRSGSYTIRYVLDGVEVSRVVPTYVFSKHGPVIWGWHAEQAAEEIARELASTKHAGPEGLKFIRKSMGFGIVQFCELIGFGKEQVVRWENGSEPIPAEIVDRYHGLLR